MKTYSEKLSTWASRNDCMEVASTWLNFAYHMSAEVWVKPQAGGVNVSSSAPLHSTIIHKLTTSLYPGGNRAYSLGTYEYAGGRGALAELLTTDGWYSLSPTSPNPIGLVPDNAWTHLAMTYNAGAGANNFKLYKNGQVIASMTATGNIASGTGNFFAGYYGRWEMKELRLWDKALSQSEIQANMRRKLTGSEVGLNAYYQFSDTTKDMAAASKDGILIYKESYVPSTLTFGSGAGAAINSLLMQ